MCRFSNGVCGGCDDFVKTTSVTFADGSLVLTIPKQTMTNGLHLCVAITQDIPAYTGVPNIKIKTGGTEYPVIQHHVPVLGGAPNDLYVDQLLKNCSGTLRARQVLSISYGTDTESFMLHTSRCLPESASGYPAPVAPTTPVTPIVATTGKAKSE